MVVRGSECLAAICTSRRTTPASSIVVTNVCLSICGCILGIRRRQWRQDGLAALAAYLQHPVAVLLTQILDVGSGGFEDPQTEQSEQADQGKVVRAGGRTPPANARAPRR